MQQGTAGGVAREQSTAARRVRGLFYPSTLLLIVANALPLVGVLYWGWDVFVLLVLYWMETATIGFWMIVQIAMAPINSLGQVKINDKPVTAGALSIARLFLAGFFMVHAGMFMGVHMVFLWSLFSGPWSKQVHGLSDFFSTLVIGTDIWIPLLVLFVVRGFGFFIGLLGPGLMQKLERSLNVQVPVRPAASRELGSIVSGFYSRVVIMHMTIILSAFVAAVFGTIAPLIIMVLVKTAADVGLHLKFDFGEAKAAPQMVPAASSN
jgi:hypothetical protein